MFLKEGKEKAAAVVIAVAITPGQHWSALLRNFIHSMSTYRTPTMCQAIIIIVVKVPALIDFILVGLIGKTHKQSNK